MALATALPANAGERFFRVDRKQGVWWLVNPDGVPGISLGVNGVSTGVPLQEYSPAEPEYCALRFHKNEREWRGATVRRLKEWGFNTAGSGAAEIVREKLPYTVTLHLGKAVGAPWEDPGSLDARVRYRELLSAIQPLKNDANLIGYFLDDELGWWDEALLLHALKRPADKHELKRRLVDMLRRAYGGDVRLIREDFLLKPVPREIGDLDGAFTLAEFRPGRRPLVVEQYVEWLAERYYKAVTEEVRKVDRNHLVLGDRYGRYYSQAVARVAGKYVDVVSTNYDTFAAQGWASPHYFETLSRLAGKPVLVSACTFAAAENRSRNRNSKGEFMTVVSQAERAAGARNLVRGLLRFPGVIGYHWNQYFDQPPGLERGEPKGADFNTGLVDLKDRPYVELVEALREANEEAAALHGTWPEGVGLLRKPKGLALTPMTDLPIVDGLLDEWPLELTWLRSAESAAPFEPFGDVYLAWHPQGLAAALVYTDYRIRQRERRGPEEATERLTLAIGREGEEPVVFTLKGLQEREDPDDPASSYRDPEIKAVRGGNAFSAQGRFLVGQADHGTTRIVEVFLPATMFKVERFEAGQMLRAAVSLRLRANFHELYWPAPFKRTDYADASTWAPLTLEVGLEDERLREAPRRASAT